MSRRKILRALSAKNIAVTLVHYDRQPTPHGMMHGWAIELDEECEEQLAALGADFEPDCETSAEVLDWIEGLPELPDRAASPTEGGR